MVRVDGTGLTRLTRSPEPDHEPAWSPDGTKIVFRSGVATQESDLYIIIADGTNLVSFTPTPGTPERGPAWSPDGSRIAFERVVNLASDLFVRILQTGHEINLSRNLD